MTDRLDVVSDLHSGRDDAEHDAVDGLLEAGFLAMTEATRSVLITPDDATGSQLRQFELADVTSAALPVQPGEDDFRIHPCFRAALNLTEEIRIGGNVTGNAVVGDSNVVQAGAVHGVVHFSNTVGTEYVPKPPDEDEPPDR